MKTSEIIEGLKNRNLRALARAITIVENESTGYDEILQSLSFSGNTHLVGITGPPGAGKSSLINALIHAMPEEKKIAVLAVDPTSPFTHGSLLGDRLRMSEHFNKSNVFIRSIATRGALGGLSAKTFEIADLLHASGFDYIFIETVGVGQSEVEIASLADTTVVVFVPESGDEVQMIKSGIVEIADIFVVNKADRTAADIMVKNIQTTLHEKPASVWNVPVLKTTAIKNDGVDELIEKINAHHSQIDHSKKAALLTAKAYNLIQNYRMHDLSRQLLHEKISEAMKRPDFNLYKFAKNLY